MFEKLSLMLKERGGKITAAILVVVALSAGAMSIRSFFHGGLPDAMYDSVYICTETGKPFHHQLQAGETLPILSPFSGKNTGVPAEACYWNADGTTKTEPTWVLLNEQVNKPGPTFCPDCGRLVKSRNPEPHEGSKPPPTEAEYNARQ